jgi:hypothetical protein
VKFMIFGLAEVTSFNKIEECLWKEPISSEKPIPRTNIVIRFAANVRVAYSSRDEHRPTDDYLQPPYALFEIKIVYKYPFYTSASNTKVSEVNLNNM